MLSKDWPKHIARSQAGCDDPTVAAQTPSSCSNACATCYIMPRVRQLEKLAPCPLAWPSPPHVKHRGATRGGGAFGGLPALEDAPWPQHQALGRAERNDASVGVCTVQITVFERTNLLTRHQAAARPGVMAAQAARPGYKLTNPESSL